MTSHEDPDFNQIESIPEGAEPPTDEQTSKMFSCDRCPKRYDQEAHLRSHQRYCRTALEKVESKMRMCHLCPAKFKKAAEFRYHMLKHNGETPYACRTEGCPKRFHSPKARLAHEKACGKDPEPEPGAVTCEVCGVSLKSQTGLVQHSLGHREPTHECHICGEKFVWKGKLRAHYLGQHQVDPPWSKKDEDSDKYDCECGDCGIVFDNYKNLKMHRRFCKATKAGINCGQCARVFTDRTQFEYHMNQHNDIRPFRCQTEGCEKAFFSPDTRKVHQRRCGKPVKPIVCSICGAKLKTADSLRTHMETHSTGPKPTCHLCGQEFTMKNNLREHLKRHANGTFQGTRVKASLKARSRYQKIEEPEPSVDAGTETRKRKRRVKTESVTPEEQPKSAFEMDEIKQEIVEEEIIVMDVQVPPPPPEADPPRKKQRSKRAAETTSSTEHRCTECGSGFTEARRLKNHMKVHLERQFECTVCGKKLLKQSSLNVHMKIHERKDAEKLGCEEDIILLKCRREGCEERFSNSGDLWEHEVECEEVGRFICDICEERIEGFDDLQRHEDDHLERYVDCRICGETFYCEKTVERHWRTHFDGDLTDSKDANWRLMESMPPSTFCDLCRKGFVTELVLARHKAFCEPRWTG